MCGNWQTCSSYSLLILPLFLLLSLFSIQTVVSSILRLLFFLLSSPSFIIVRIMIVISFGSDIFMHRYTSSKKKEEKQKKKKKNGSEKKRGFICYDSLLIRNDDHHQHHVSCTRIFCSILKIPSSPKPEKDSLSRLWFLLLFASYSYLLNSIILSRVISLSSRLNLLHLLPPYNRLINFVIIIAPFSTDN